MYCVVCFKIRRTIKEVFVVDVMDVALANHWVFTQWHTHDVEVASMQCRKANGIPSPSCNEIDNP